MLGKLLLAPVTAPLGATLWLSKKVHEAAETELNDPAEIKRELTRLEAQLEAGEITEEAFEEVELVLLTRLKAVWAGRGD